LLSQITHFQNEDLHSFKWLLADRGGERESERRVDAEATGRLKALQQDAGWTIFTGVFTHRRAAGAWIFGKR
jgi:hypothetical protein